MENHIAPAIIKARAQTLFDLSKQLRHTNAQALIGKEVSVLFEKHTKFGTTGYSEHYYPMLVHQQVKLNELMLVKVEQITDNMIIGRVVSSHEAR